MGLDLPTRPQANLVPVTTPLKQHPNGLVLPGGGARAAYQVGVLQALAEALPPSLKVPFPVISGASAGAINAALLATHAGDFQEGVAHLSHLWGTLSVDRVYRTDLSTVAVTCLRWLWGLVRGFDRAGVRSLLDNQPLRELLERELDFEAVQHAIDSGVLRGVAVTAAGYTSSESVTYFQATKEWAGWRRARREGRPSQLTVEHVMASIAIPIIFPAARIEFEWHGDGSMRQRGPVSPAIHLGANRILVIALCNNEPRPMDPGHPLPYPTFGHIAGYVLDSLFMDAVFADLERINRINYTVAEMGPERAANPGHELRPIDARIIVPSMDIGDLVQLHQDAFPRTVRKLFSLMGAHGIAGQHLRSYLLFDQGFCKALMDLGYRDGMARKDELVPWLSGE